MFSALYHRVLNWSAHKHAVYYLMALSFIESSFFPIPPDVMLGPMCLAHRERAWYFAMLTTIASVIGGIFGYLIGMFAFDIAVQPVVAYLGYEDKFIEVEEWFNRYGVWIIFTAGFTPIPYKLFTIGAGIMAMPFLPFVIASIIGRGARFFLVAGLIILGGQKLEDNLRKYVDTIGWTTVVLILALGFYIWLR
ncbi:MAG TPA: YqaA family protein [Gammaproteobacteria bacterium]|nr:YqaA family protein [Gammaproteobacteria bacterium]